MQLIEISVSDIGGESQQTCSARDLWAFLESKQEFANWIKGRIEKYGFVEGLDYTLNKIVERENQGLRNWQERIEYRLSLDMGKQIAMVEGNQKGREVRRYFSRLRTRREAAGRRPQHGGAGRPGHPAAALADPRRANAGPGSGGQGDGPEGRGPGSHRDQDGWFDVHHPAHRRKWLYA